MRTAQTLSQARAARLDRAVPRRFHGACACGSVRFLVKVALDTVTRCICAKCRGLGLRMATGDRADFRLLTGRDELTEVIAEAKSPHHFFCARCGEPGFGYVDGANGTRVTVNVDWLERGDLDAVTGVDDDRH